MTPEQLIEQAEATRARCDGEAAEARRNVRRGARAGRWFLVLSALCLLAIVGGGVLAASCTEQDTLPAYRGTDTLRMKMAHAAKTHTPRTLDDPAAFQAPGTWTYVVESGEYVVNEYINEDGDLVIYIEFLTPAVLRLRCRYGTQDDKLYMMQAGGWALVLVDEAFVAWSEQPETFRLPRDR